MKRLLLKLSEGLLLLVILTLVLVVIWRVSINWPLDTSWKEYQRINTLTERYGDELFEAIKGAESIFTINGYKNKDELGLYLTGEEFYVYQEAWDKIHNGEKVVSGETILVSPQVVSYTGKIAEVVAEVHTAKKVRYGPNGPEIVDPSYKWAGMLHYILKFEDGRWKVWRTGRCPFSDAKCIRSMKHIEDKWYHSFIE